jgi:hypothetical protein
MYNFHEKTFDNRMVSYCSVPNFALEIVEEHPTLTNAAKLVYSRALRWAVRQRNSNYNFSIAWFVEKLKLDRKTVSSAIKQLKELNFFSDNGIVIPTPREQDFIKTNKTNNHTPISTQQVSSDNRKQRQYQTIQQPTTEKVEIVKSAKPSDNQPIHNSELETTSKASVENVKDIITFIEFVGVNSKVASLQIKKLTQMGFDYNGFIKAQRESKGTKIDLNTFINDSTTEEKTPVAEGIIPHQCPKIPHPINNTISTIRNNNTGGVLLSVQNVGSQPPVILPNKGPIYHLDKFIKGALSKLVPNSSIPTMLKEVKCDLQRRISQGETNIRKNLNFIFKLISTDQWNCRYT